MSSDPLRKAQRDFLNGNYSRVISYLEPLSLTYRDSHLFYYLLGASCLYTGDIGGASTYLHRAEQLNFRHAETLAALAAVHVRRGETDKAVQLYLDILEREPGNRFAKKALDFLKSNSGEEKIAKLASSGAIAALYPKPPALTRKIVRIGGSLVLVLIIVGALFFLLPNVVHKIGEANPSRDGLEAFTLTADEKDNPVTVQGEFKYVLTEREALSVFENAKRLFRTWHDEAALVELNRLLLSNASPSIKNKAETLKGFIKDPDFSSVKDRYAYTDVARDPHLFEGVAVLWKGSATNIQDEETGPRFDFLVGYQDRKRLEGVVTVQVAFPIRLTPGRPLEVLGRVRIIENGFEIEGLAIHELAEEES